MTQDKSIVIKNIYYMLSYAFKVLKQSNYEKIASENFENIHNLFASILSTAVAQQLKQGLYREYVSQIEDLATVRGKINMPETMRKKISRTQRIVCEVDNLTENNMLNQILKTTMLLLMRRSDVEDKYKEELRREILFFSEVDEINVFSIQWSLLRFHKHNQTYQMLIYICYFILDEMLLTTDKGEYHLASFMDEQQMSALYEKFILSYYRKEYPELNAIASQISWALDDDMSQMLPIMQTDITLSTKDNSRVLIIDAKYYSKIMQRRLDKYTIHSNNLYQIFAYVKNMAVQCKRERKSTEVSGMLLYARTDEEIQPDNNYMMSGNRISVKTLDLNRPFSEISAQLDQIADSLISE
ncbi:MAG: 5-methylcytosine-specific restriction endonuclease system specificity protein McrC [Bifidobacteriaceae bacterium]|nr:5-methylcytosine-specific restriction endonuclease system specificity protein McrC [Bifidobacteriaceae bacterium]